MGRPSCFKCWRILMVVYAVLLLGCSSLTSGARDENFLSAALPRRQILSWMPPRFHPPKISSGGPAFPLLPSSVSEVSTNQRLPRVFHVTDFGADPTGLNDSAGPISLAVEAAVAAASSSTRNLLAGISDLGGVQIHLDGGRYLLSRPLRLPTGIGNLKDGSLLASDDFPSDGYLIELSGGNAAPIHYELITLKDLTLDANHRGGGTAIINSLRTTVDNCYIVRFATDGVLVRGGHETLIRSSFVGQKITAGGDPEEKNFSGVGINLSGNDNAVTDVVVFSAAVGVLISGQANTLSGVHCYNKASGFGGVGIYLRLPRLTQTRIINCYLDYTGIVAEDPVELLVMGSFFLGDANVVFKSVDGVVRGVTIVDNLFSGGGNGVEIVSLDETARKFSVVDQVTVERNAVMGMKEKVTSAKASVSGKGTTWTVDFSSVLLFPDRIEGLQYTVAVNGGLGKEIVGPPFSTYRVRRVEGNKVMVESEAAVSATVYVAVDQ
ncbi:polygalacturonase QRT3-like isoform X2 [Wolffia australiana]